ncbi:MAG TPA: phosphoenolpyruvate carboxykinase (ATP) [Phycisphaerae bacterium]|nr:phosphoenolpyruvate carboxykinase (ATP) [Phycisphaerae bacterium]HNU43863.1 phosphoenolpyruvate carboxykinase (ATP) [Phycisphaerae bacterium]
MNNYLDVQTPAGKEAGELASEYQLKNHGLIHLDRVYWNLATPALVEEAVFRGEGSLVEGGPLLVRTGKHTARAAADKFTVREDSTADKIWWGQYNRPFSGQSFHGLFLRMQSYLQGRQVWVQDCYAGADPEYRLPIRVITDSAWQSLFARNMFITPTSADEYKKFVPEFTLIVLPSFKADPRADGTRTETAIVLNFAQHLGLIADSSYGGEIKKTVFTILNFLLPLRNVMAMHCSANVGAAGDVALFFGLSGTGKTSLSADPKRRLIGDDEHGWSDGGVFNFEAGCYAKVIRLSAEHEPQIYAATRRFGCILENVIHDPLSRRVDLNDDQLTENTRASYPLDFIPNVVPERMTRTHPKNVIFLTCDATGVLPPIARLSPNQAMYHFISGYTSKVAGTEIGLGKEPELTFSACFGAPFMVHHPFVYARLLNGKMAQHGSQPWLVNTGWTGGKFGVGKRFSIHHTRALLNAALDGSLQKVKFRKDKVFGFEVPMECPGVPSEVLDPASTWKNKDEYWRAYDALAARYIENFKLFKEGCAEEVANAGPKRLSNL